MALALQINLQINTAAAADGGKSASCHDRL